MNKNLKKNLKRIFLAQLVAMLLPIVFFIIMGILYYSGKIIIMYFFLLILIVFLFILSILIMTGKYQTVLNSFWKDVLIFGFFERKYHKIWGFFLLIMSALFLITIVKMGFDILMDLNS